MESARRFADEHGAERAFDYTEIRIDGIEIDMVPG